MPLIGHLWWDRFSRGLREKKDCTQRELAAELGVTERCVSNWETGRTVPRLKHQRALRETAERIGWAPATWPLFSRPYRRGPQRAPRAPRQAARRTG